VSAQNVPELFVTALTDQVQVDLAQRRQKPVGVVLKVLYPVAVRDPDPVVRHLCGRQDTNPDALELMAQLGARAVVQLDNDAVRQRFERTNGDSAVVWVGSQEFVRVVMCPSDQPLQLTTVDGLHG